MEIKKRIKSMEKFGLLLPNYILFQKVINQLFSKSDLTFKSFISIANNFTNTILNKK